MASEQLKEFERLNTTTQSIHDLGNHKVLIILKDGTNLTSWEDVENRDDVIYVSEDLSDYKNLSEKYMDLRSARAIVAFGLSDRVRSMKYMFAHCESLTDLSGLAGLDVSRISDMEAMFASCYSLEDLTPLAGWDVSNVRSMNWMFEGCCRLTSLDGLDSWDVSGADSMIGTFCDCYLDDISSLAGWDVSNVTNMSVLFGIAMAEHRFNCKGNPIADLSPIALWDVSNLEDMWSMFRGAFRLNDLTPLAGWDVSNVRDMSRMFAQCPSLHDLSGIGGWDVSGVKDFSSMFADCYSLESLDAISRWKVSKKARMDDIFKGCARLSDAACLNSWDLGNINVHSLFDECPLLRTLPHWVYRPKPARRFNPFDGLFRRAQKRESKARFATIDYAVSLKTGKITFTSDIVFDPERDSDFINGILLEDDNLLIDGDGHTIDARGMARVFEVTGKNITIRNFIFLNCRAGEGGAIINRGTLRLENVKFSVCRADFGGAICNASGEITIKDVEFSANMAEYGGGAIHNDGGDILIWDCLIHQNRAQHGAISNSGGRIRLRNTCIRRNRASCKGSAIANDGGVMSISACTLRENASEGFGVVVNSNGEVRIEESDIKCNSAKDYMIHNAGNLEINNCLLRLNRSKGIMFNEGEGHFIIFDSELVDNCIEESVVCNKGGRSLIEKTLFADNLGPDRLWNVINAGELTLDGIQINDSGVTIWNDGVILLKHPTDDLIDKIKSEGRLDLPQ